MNTYFKPSPIRGLKNDGSEVWYTGKAGQEFVSANKADAWTGYNLEGARRKATKLNAYQSLHGIRFMVPVPDSEQA